MREQLTAEEEQQIADLFKERLELELKRGNGVTLDKNGYIGDRVAEIEKELSRLKTPKQNPTP